MLGELLCQPPISHLYLKYIHGIGLHILLFGLLCHQVEYVEYPIVLHLIQPDEVEVHEGECFRPITGRKQVRIELVPVQLDTHVPEVEGRKTQRSKVPPRNPVVVVHIQGVHLLRV